MKWIVILAAASIGGFAASAANAQEDLAKKDGCMNCHDVSAKKVGPSFKEVAAKYKGKADAEATLTAKIKEGKGHPATKASADDLKGIVKWGVAIYERGLRYFTTREFAGHRVARQQALRGVSQRFADAVDTSMVRRNQAVSIRDAGRDRQSRCAGNGAQAGGDQTAARQHAAHARPTIIAPTCLLNPAALTMAT